MAEPEAFAIDIYAIFGQTLLLRGWAFDPAGITQVQLRIGDRRVAIPSYGRTASADIVAHHGVGANGSRFEEAIAFDPAVDDVIAAELVLTCRNGQVRSIGQLGFPRGQLAMALPQVFRSMLQERPAGALLEVGSRARSGVIRRDLVPDGWSYVGLDVLEGPNVDIVGDAHELGELFPERRFDAVMAFSVLEHLIMPWKFVLELNRVLNDGAIGCFTTHQAWPLHDTPWDFWRFSDKAWHALFNPATGFEVIHAEMGEPAYFVAQRCHAVTHFGMDNTGYLASNVVFRKISGTELRWPVRVGDITETSYPLS